MESTATNPFEDTAAEYRVLCDTVGQYSLRPVFAEVPGGWHPVYGPGPTGWPGG